LLIVKREIYS